MGGRVTRRSPWLAVPSLALFECFRQICSEPFHGGLHLPLGTTPLFLLEKVVQGRGIVAVLPTCVH